MAGKFINQQQKMTIDTLTDNVKTILNNPYYMYEDKKAATADYWNINNTKSTLDEATRTKYAELGPNNPLRFNLIKNFYLYGIERISLDYDMGDFGLESSEITGEAVILPNTIIPYVGDYFRLYQIDKPYLFSVTKVDENTLDTGAILYKIQYKLKYMDLHGIDKQTVEEYNMVANNVGTNFKAVIQSSKYDLIRELESYTIRLKEYYNMLFYDERVQTYTFLYNNLFKVYDPYMVEFIIRNKILEGTSKYIYPSHQMVLPTTFGIDYDKTIFASLEAKDPYRTTIAFIGNMLECTQKLSLLTAYFDKYYYMEYKQLNQKFYSIPILDLDILDRIRNCDLKENTILDNIIIKYYNDKDLTFEDMHKLNNVDYCENLELYYKIPIVIFCIERIIVNLLK